MTGLADDSNWSPYLVGNVEMGLPGRECGVWTIRSNDVFAHPFHIHVNPFYVLAVEGDYSSFPNLTAVVPDFSQSWTIANLVGTWRDTVMVPPFGSVTIKQCYDAGPTPTESFAGKHLFHCHFADHEDTGLMKNVMLVATDVENAANDPLSATAVGLIAAGSVMLAIAAAVLVAVFLQRKAAARQAAEDVTQPLTGSRETVAAAITTTSAV